MLRLVHILTGLALAALGLVAPDGATTLYSNDFESSSTANFTGSTGLLTAPGNGTTFLGPLSFGSSATLTLGGLGAKAEALTWEKP